MRIQKRKDCIDDLLLKYIEKFLTRLKAITIEG